MVTSPPPAMMEGPGVGLSAFDSPPIKKLPWLAITSGFLRSSRRFALLLVFCPRAGAATAIVKIRMDLQFGAFIDPPVSLMLRKMNSDKKAQNTQKDFVKFLCLFVAIPLLHFYLDAQFDHTFEWKPEVCSCADGVP